MPNRDLCEAAGAIKFAKIDCVTSGNNTLVAAVAGNTALDATGNAAVAKKIRVLSYLIVSAGTATAAFQSGATGTALTGAMSLIANGRISAEFSPAGHFETAAGVLLNLSLSAGIQMSGHLVYQEV